MVIRCRKLLQREASKISILSTIQLIIFDCYYRQAWRSIADEGKERPGEKMLLPISRCANCNRYPNLGRTWPLSWLLSRWKLTMPLQFPREAGITPDKLFAKSKISTSWDSWPTSGGNWCWPNKEKPSFGTILSRSANLDDQILGFLPTKDTVRVNN